jgi:hypothetical protein
LEATAVFYKYSTNDLSKSSSEIFVFPFSSSFSFSSLPEVPDPTGNQVPLHQLKKPHQLILSLLWLTLNPFVINNFDREVTSQQIKRKGK